MKTSKSRKVTPPPEEDRAQLERAMRDYLAFLEHENDRLTDEVHQLSERALYDSLTGLYNRGAFEELLTQAWGDMKRFEHGADGIANLSLLCLDLDDLKLINDTHGHAAGDQALKHLSSALKARVRENDITGRLGGDELALALPYTDEAGALVVAQCILDEMKEPFLLQGSNKAITSSVSIGVAVHTEGDKPEDVIRKADMALLHAKADGKGGVACYRSNDEAGQ